MKTHYLFLILAFYPTLLLAQATATAKNDTLAWFDFWLGEWELHWFEKDSVKAIGENIITKDLGGSVITENFKVLAGQNKGYLGRSVSLFDNRSQSWRQTWVDNAQAYLEFTGGKEGHTYFFERRFTARNGKDVMQKMVFHHITTEGFIWDWKGSTDTGKTWNTNWQIYYTRKKTRQASPDWTKWAYNSLQEQVQKSGRSWLPFFTIPTMKMGLYTLKIGAVDKQSPHDTDEAYYVAKGKAMFKVGDEKMAVKAGDILFVKAGKAHQFFDIAEDLELLVFFTEAK
jgi:mannose-6-phosphate isomerase-like protein (cupin superfamily)